MTAICKTFGTDMLINTVQRKPNGDITVNYYCTSQENKKITHDDCNKFVIYKNGEGYNENRKITKEERFPNLIGCWCDDNLRFQTPVEAQNHRMEKHPEEFDN